jgi:hypothetical protein
MIACSRQYFQPHGSWIMSTKVSTPFYKTLVNEAFAAARERIGSSHKMGTRKLHELLEADSWVRVFGKSGSGPEGEHKGVDIIPRRKSACQRFFAAIRERIVAPQTLPPRLTMNFFRNYLASVFRRVAGQGGFRWRWSFGARLGFRRWNKGSESGTRGPGPRLLLEQRPK